MNEADWAPSSVIKPFDSRTKKLDRDLIVTWTSGISRDGNEQTN